MSTIQEQWETLKGERLKTFAEDSLDLLGQHELGRRALELYAFGPEGRIVDDRFRTSILGIELENPVVLGAGWDKRGITPAALPSIGFAAAEIGTVLLHPQPGNPTPRLFTIDSDHSVGLNRLGYNSPGVVVVSTNLEKHGILPIPIGINIGLNKLTDARFAAEAHAAVVPHIAKFASYIALGISSPNTEQVRGLQRKGPLTEITVAVQEAIAATGKDMPLIFKVDGDQTYEQLYEVLEVAMDLGAAGIAGINSTTRSKIKARYGSRWEKEAGGLSGDDEKYRKLANDKVRFIYEEAGDRLDVFGIGGIKDAETALEKIKAGASAVQVVTAMRPSWGKVAANILKDLGSILDREGVSNVEEIIGVDTKRGARSV